MSWSTLGYRARAWRALHAAWSVAQLAGLAYIWAAVLRRRRSRGVWAATAFLIGEGAALLVGRGDCPMASVQTRWGDPVPFFEIVLPPRAARAAVPILAVVSLAALAGLVWRPPLPQATPSSGPGLVTASRNRAGRWPAASTRRADLRRWRRPM